MWSRCGQDWSDPICLDPEGGCPHVNLWVIRCGQDVVKMWARLGRTYLSRSRGWLPPRNLWVIRGGQDVGKMWASFGRSNLARSRGWLPPGNLWIITWVKRWAIFGGRIWLDPKGGSSRAIYEQSDVIKMWSILGQYLNGPIWLDPEGGRPRAVEHCMCTALTHNRLCTLGKKSDGKTYWQDDWPPKKWIGPKPNGQKSMGSINWWLNECFLR